MTSFKVGILFPAFYFSELTSLCSLVIISNVKLIYFRRGRYNGTKKANVYYEAGRVHNQEA